MEPVKKTTNFGWGGDNLWAYTVLPEPFLSAELERLSGPKSAGDTDSISYQPCAIPEESNQDRYVVEDWDLPGGTWSFRAIFDGHAGHDTVDYTASELPKQLRASVSALLCSDKAPPFPAVISDAVAKSVAKFDEDIGQALVDIFPDETALSSMTDEEIKVILHDGGRNSTAVLRCMRGTTALISIIDPSKANLWVASLGDCAAIMGTKDESGEWMANVLSSAHNGENSTAAKEVMETHPGEPEAMLNQRVLGIIAVTRAIGDFSFKLPAIYTERVLVNANPPFGTRGLNTPEKIQAYLARNITPPYLSGTPDMQHVDLTAISGENFLILCTDGLTDAYDADRLKLHEVLAPRWVKHVGKAYGGSQNLALALLRDALGGDDTDQVSSMITVEKDSRWIDDTTIIIQRL